QDEYVGAVVLWPGVAGDEFWRELGRQSGEQSRRQGCEQLVEAVYVAAVGLDFDAAVDSADGGCSRPREHGAAERAQAFAKSVVEQLEAAAQIAQPQRALVHATPQPAHGDVVRARPELAAQN